MKNLSFSEVRKFTFVVIALLVVVFTGCSKGDNGSGQVNPPPPPPPATPVINLPTAPTTPLWNGDGFSGSITISNPVAGAVLYQDGTVNTSGTLSLSNLTASKTVNFELRKSVSDGTLLATASITIPVYTSDQSNIERYGSWKEYREQEDTTIGLTGAYHDVSVPICNQDDFHVFNNKTGLCTTNAGPMTCGLPQVGQSQFIFQNPNGVKKLQWANADPSGWYTIIELTATNMVLTKNVFDLGRNRYINVKYFYQH